MRLSVLSRAPHRVSLLGGGSDLPDFIKNRGKGASLAFAIKPNITTLVKSHSGLFDEKFRLNYSTTELCSDVSEIKNVMAKSALNAFDENGPLYISTSTDIPDRCGLSSSSAFLAGLSGALAYDKDGKTTREQIARTCHEIEYGAGRACGYQDSYSIVYGE